MWSWWIQFPKSWGLDRARIHASLVLTLLMVSGLFLVLGIIRADAHELMATALTLPIVWIISLAVRLATQHLAVGGYSEELDIMVGPTGNLHTDYEFLPPRVVFSYSIAGQLASVALASLGLAIHAAMLPHTGRPPAWVDVLGFEGGFGSQSWASQLLWVNVFLFCMHLLPTVPFDMRATAYAIMGGRDRVVQEPRVFRALGSLDSHLAAMLLGSGIAAFAVGQMTGQPIVGWYAAIAAAVYLFVAAQWEAARAEELEEEYLPRRHREIEQRSPEYSTKGGLPAPSSRTNRRHEDDDSPDLSDGFTMDWLAGAEEAEAEHPAETDEPHEPWHEPEELGDRPSESSLDIDEILRKIHRHGREALTDVEREALLDASRRLKRRRDATSS
ncbi:MAG: hypothetical protein KatS3mg111_0961 [Pirellulaceae bacterium]|nr:MAG: hypothetical protein KatS3mg111_0961 [Pirellulaceae bacterium]